MTTIADAAREYAHNAGMDEPEQAWILSPWDSWERNPFYSGPRVPHPEDDCNEQETFIEMQDGIEARGGALFKPFARVFADDEIPF